MALTKLDEEELTEFETIASLSGVKSNALANRMFKIGKRVLAKKIGVAIKGIFDEKTFCESDCAYCG